VVLLLSVSGSFAQASSTSPGYELFLLLASGGALALVWSALNWRSHPRTDRGVAPSLEQEATQGSTTRAVVEAREVLLQLQGSILEIENRLDGRIRTLEKRLDEAKELENRLGKKLAGDPGAAPRRPEGFPIGPEENRSDEERSSQLEVERLASEGNDAEEISRRTGRPVGEVEVILALRRQLRSKTS